MHIETDIKLDFSDVLLKPKRSSLQSRKDVVLKRKFQFMEMVKTLEIGCL